MTFPNWIMYIIFKFLVTFVVIFLGNYKMINYY